MTSAQTPQSAALTPTSEVAAPHEAGWVRRLLCDVVDSIILSTLRAGVAAQVSRAAGFLNMLLAEVRNCRSTSPLLHHKNIFA